MSQAWENYEQVAAFLLNRFKDEFGLEQFEGKQTVEGKKSGATWEIDAKGISENGEGFVIVECRRYTSSKLNKNRLAQLHIASWILGLTEE